MFLNFKIFSNKLEMSFQVSVTDYLSFQSKLLCEEYLLVLLTLVPSYYFSLTDWSILLQICSIPFKIWLSKKSSFLYLVTISFSSLTHKSIKTEPWKYDSAVHFVSGLRPGRYMCIFQVYLKTDFSLSNYKKYSPNFHIFLD